MLIGSKLAFSTRTGLCNRSRLGILKTPGESRSKNWQVDTAAAVDARQRGDSHPTGAGQLQGAGANSWACPPGPPAVRQNTTVARHGIFLLRVRATATALT